MLWGWRRDRRPSSWNICRGRRRNASPLDMRWWLFLWFLLSVLLLLIFLWLRWYTTILLQQLLCALISGSFFQIGYLLRPLLLQSVNVGLLARCLPAKGGCYCLSHSIDDYGSADKAAIVWKTPVLRANDENKDKSGNEVGKTGIQCPKSFSTSASSTCFVKANCRRADLGGELRKGFLEGGRRGVVLLLMLAPNARPYVWSTYPPQPRHCGN